MPVEMIGFSLSEMLVEMMGCCLDAGSGDVLLQVMGVTWMLVLVM